MTSSAIHPQCQCSEVRRTWAPKCAGAGSGSLNCASPLMSVSRCRTRSTSWAPPPLAVRSPSLGNSPETCRGMGQKQIAAIAYASRPVAFVCFVACVIWCKGLFSAIIQSETWAKEYGVARLLANSPRRWGVGRGAPDDLARALQRLSPAVPGFDVVPRGWPSCRTGARRDCRRECQLFQE